MEDYIKIDRINKEIDFVNLVMTTTNIDAKMKMIYLKLLKKMSLN